MPDVNKLSNKWQPAWFYLYYLYKQYKNSEVNGCGWGVQIVDFNI